ncbi:hypothetical protein WICMUC_002360 [Wickerhamomyces mucosus]|uniref:alpha-1,2-Mannosidase n=1 Tax=Wickerhamomyces mucosus TaxID=1378264 RepID=A0A9P8PPJ9_9ASCO|nr:hypothetical protein WICMUC_002360 [Wickerhamomyces mucosus]
MFAALSHRLRRLRFTILVIVTFVFLFYYSFLNEEYSLNNHLGEEDLPLVTNPLTNSKLNSFLQQSNHHEPSEELAIHSNVIEKNKYFPLLDIEEANGKAEGKLPDDYFKNQKQITLREWQKKSRYPVGKENYFKFPKLNKPDQYPIIQSNYFSDGGKRVPEKISSIKAAFDKSWELYKKFGYGHDEVLPLTEISDDPFNGWSATLVDSLDILYLMGEKGEFNDAIQFIKTVNFAQSFREDIPVFENVIRILGGLISAYDLSNEKVFLESATDLAGLILEAFDTPNRMPMLYYKWFDKVQNKFASKEACLAEVGSLSLEFSRLTQLTGDNKYFDAITRITNLFEKSYENFLIEGLYTNKIDISGCKLLSRDDIDQGIHLNNPYVIKSMFNRNFVYCLLQQDFVPALDEAEHYSIGGLADSFYEYLPKMFHLLRGDEKNANIYKDMYLRAMNPVREYMLFHPKIPNGENILFVSSLTVRNGTNYIDVQQDLDMQHLTCFTGGMFALGAQLFNITEDLAIAEKITLGCVELYDKLKVMPERIVVDKLHGSTDSYNEKERLNFIKEHSIGGDSELYRNNKGVSGKSSADKSSFDKKAYIPEIKELEKRPSKSLHLSSAKVSSFPAMLKNSWPVGKTSNLPIWANEMDPSYILRPEAIESVFYMYRITGDSKWRDYGWKMWQGVESFCKTKKGTYVSIYDITLDVNDPDRYIDSMESFWFTETLKYYYLLFEDISVLSLDEYVLNTEAHSFKLTN